MFQVLKNNLKLFFLASEAPDYPGFPGLNLLIYKPTWLPWVSRFKFKFVDLQTHLTTLGFQV